MTRIREERGSHLIPSYYRRFGFVEVDQGCMYSRLDNHSTFSSSFESLLSSKREHFYLRIKLMDVIRCYYFAGSLHIFRKGLDIHFIIWFTLNETAKEMWLQAWKSVRLAGVTWYINYHVFQADSLIFKDRKLNVGPAIRKQVVLM